MPRSEPPVFIDEEPSLKRHSLLLAVSLIVLVGLALRLFALDSQGFFIDEIYSVLVARGDADPELMVFDSIRPLYFAGLSAWMKLGQSEFWLRLPSVAFGAANIILVYWLGKIGAGRGAGLVAAILIALSPLEVHYARQARMYTLGSFLALTGSLSLLLAWQQKRKLWLLSYGFSRVLMIWTLPLTAVLLPVDLLLSILEERKNKLFATFAIAFTLILAGALVFAWKMPIISIFNAYDAWRGTLPLPSALDAAMVLVNFTSNASPIQECLGPREGGPLAVLYSALILSLFLLSAFTVKKNRTVLWCLGWTLIPLLGAWVVSQTGTCFLIVRYLLFASPFAFVSLAAGFIFLASKSRLAAILATLLYSIIIPLNLYSLATHPIHEDWRLAAKFIEQNEKPGDKILVWTYHAPYVWNYYYQGINKNQIYDFQVTGLSSPGHAQELQEKELKVWAQGPDNDLTRVHGRCWIVIKQSIKNWDKDWTIYQSVFNHLKQKYRVIKYQPVTKLDVMLLDCGK